MNTPLVSVIIPTLPKRKKQLQNAVDSVKKQTYKNIELLIVTEGITAGEARNIGIQRSKGEFIAFLDDDDTWQPTKIEKQLELIKQHPNCPLVTCYSHDKRFNQDKINKPPEVTTQKQILNAFNYSSTSTYLIRKYQLNLIKGFDTSLPSAQEYDLAIRLSDKHNPRCVPEILVTQNATKDQISQNWSKKAKGIQQVYKKHKDLFLNSSPINRVKLYALFVVFYMGHIFGDKIYKILSPMKQRYEEPKDIMISHGTIQHFDNKLAQSLKEKGYNVYSISIYKPQDEFLKNFDKSYYLLDKPLKSKLKTILRIINRLPRLSKAKKQHKRTTVIGISEPNTFISYIFHIFRKSTKIYFPYNITFFKYESYNQNPYLERYFEKRNFNKCNAIIHKGPKDELNLLPYEFKATDKPSIQFLPYCSYKSLLPLNDTTSDKTRLVYVGGVYPNFKIFSKISQLPGITLDIYPLNYNQIKDYKNLNIHEPIFGEKLTEEISKYDYGIHIFDLDEKKHKKRLLTYMGDKLSTYVEAGLPVVIEKKFIHASSVVEENKLGFIINNISELKDINRYNDYYNFTTYRKKFTFENHIEELIEFINEVKE